MDLKKHISKITKCRISGSKHLQKIINLGEQPVANSLKKNQTDSEVKFSLSLSYCEESSLLQLNETIDKEILFKHYIWVSGTSAVTKRYANTFFRQVIDIVNPQKDDLIVEIASNDGTFLKPFLDNNFRKILGVDPAKNIVEIAIKQGVNTLAKFWNSSIAKQIIAEHGHAKVIFARNVIPHVSELLDVIEGIETTLKEDGVGIIEFHDAGMIQNELHYDSIYHEHLCYFSIKSLTFLLNRFNLNPFHIEKSPISGGSLVIYFSKEKRAKTIELDKAILKETKNQTNNLLSWQNFAKQVEKHREKTLTILNQFKDKKIIGFGSSARSQTYLNYCGVNNSHISVIIDNNPLKQGLFTPGSSIPIVNFEQGIRSNPDFIFILAWNFKDEIVQECRSSGYKGAFIVPFPGSPYII